MYRPIPGLQMIHAIAGRIRLKIAGVQSNRALAVDLERQLSAIAIIQRTQVNARTGSVLLGYDPDTLGALLALGFDDPRVVELLDALLTLAESLGLRPRQDEAPSLKQWVRQHLNDATPETVQRYQAQLRRL